MKVAILENQVVINIIEDTLGVSQKLFDHTALQTNESNPAWIGARYNGVKFEAIQIYNSWAWNEEAFDYKPPTPMPDDGKPYYWNESELAWVEIIPPEPDETPE